MKKPGPKKSARAATAPRRKTAVAPKRSATAVPRRKRLATYFDETRADFPKTIDALAKN